MKKTLQDQYLLIKEGKGHKGVFLTEAKREFPHIVRNAATFDEAVASLKTKNIISENVLTVMPAIIDRPKKEAYETAFEAFLAEAKKKKDEDEKVKAEEKKVSKPVEEDLAHNYDNSDEKNPDNMIFDQIMTGYYAEMKDPKNANKTMQQLKDIVFKNLAKDPIYYTKDGQFGIKDLGYVTEAPGLGTPKEVKGKYKSSGYGDLNESIFDRFKSKPLGDVEGEKESLKKSIITFLKNNTNFKAAEKLTDRELLKALEGFARHGNSKTSSSGNRIAYDLYKIAKPLFETDEPVEKFTSDFKDRVTNKKDSKFTPEEITAKIAQKRKEELEDRKLRGESLEEIAIRETIQNMVFEELNKEEYKDTLFKLEQPYLNDKEALDNIQQIYRSHIAGLNSIAQDLEENDLEEVMYQAPSVSTSNTGGGGRRFIPSEVFLSQELINKLNFSNPGPNTPSRDESLQIPHIKFLTKPEGSIMLISNFLYNAIQGLERGRTSREKEMGKNELEKLISDLDPMVRALIKKNVDPKMSFGNYHAVNMPIDRKKGVGVTIPLSKEEKEELEEMIIRESLLKEGVEKEIAEINKMAEYEILESKLQKLTDAIEKRRSQLVKLDEDEDMKALTDKKKIKELEKDIKTLEKAKVKLEKIASKHKGKVKKTEVIDETEEDLGEAEGYIEDADSREDAGQNPQDIVDTYTNLPSDKKDDLEDYLEDREDNY
jgi:hypothetical protein